MLEKSDYKQNTKNYERSKLFVIIDGEELIKRFENIKKYVFNILKEFFR